MDWENDPFFRNKRTYDGPVPPDLSERLDEYLYEEMESDLDREDGPVTPEWPDPDQD